MLSAILDEMVEDLARTDFDDRLAKWRRSERAAERTTERWYEQTERLVAELHEIGVTLEVNIWEEDTYVMRHDGPQLATGISSCGWCGYGSSVGAQVLLDGAAETAAATTEICLGCVLGDELNEYPTDSLREADISKTLWPLPFEHYYNFDGDTAERELEQFWRAG